MRKQDLCLVMALLFDTLFTRVYGQALDTLDEVVLHRQLTDLIGCEDEPTFFAFGTGDRAGRTAISPRDFARFGLLYLRQGLIVSWNNTRVEGRDMENEALKRLADAVEPSERH